MNIKGQLTEINQTVNNGLVFNFVENKYDTFGDDTTALLYLVMELNTQHLQMKQEYLKLFKQLQEGE